MSRSFLFVNVLFIALAWVCSVNQNLRFAIEDFVYSVFWYTGIEYLYFYLLVASLLISFSCLKKSRLVVLVITLSSCVLLTALIVRQAIAVLYEHLELGIGFVGFALSSIILLLIAINLYKVLGRRALVVAVSFAGSLPFSIVVMFHLLDSINQST